MAIRYPAESQSSQSSRQLGPVSLVLLNGKPFGLTRSRVVLVVVVEAEAAMAAAVAGWLETRGLGTALAVLDVWHLPLSGEQLADFARAFPALRYEVRPPNLDDMFLKLALPS